MAEQKKSRTKAQDKPEAKKDDKQIFKFESDVAYLYVDEVKAQFRKGKFETTNENVANVLRKLYAVREVK